MFIFMYIFSVCVYICIHVCIYMAINLFSGSLIYEKLGERAFGWPGKMAAFVSIIMQNIGGEKKRHTCVTLIKLTYHFHLVTTAMFIITLL